MLQYTLAAEFLAAVLLLLGIYSRYVLNSRPAAM
jgi:hypothetical protein